MKMTFPFPFRTEGDPMPVRGEGGGPVVLIRVRREVDCILPTNALEVDVGLLSIRRADVGERAAVGRVVRLRLETSSEGQAREMDRDVGRRGRCRDCGRPLPEKPSTTSMANARSLAD